MTQEPKRDSGARSRVNNELVIRMLMAQPEGRRWLWDKVADLRVFSTTQQFGENASLTTAFLEGKRSVGLALLADMTRLCPTEYGLAVVENGARNDHGNSTSRNRSRGSAPERADGADDDTSGDERPGGTVLWDD